MKQAPIKGELGIGAGFAAGALLSGAMLAAIVFLISRSDTTTTQAGFKSTERGRHKMNTAAMLLGDSRGFEHMSGWGAGWMWVWGTLMMVGTIAVIVWLARSTSTTAPPPQTPSRPADRAQQVLAERYAHGEISTEEYRERLENLTND